jgi:hypothetical protein
MFDDYTCKLPRTSSLCVPFGDVVDVVAVTRHKHMHVECGYEAAMMMVMIVVALFIVCRVGLGVFECF